MSYDVEDRIRHTLGSVAAATVVPDPPAELSGTTATPVKRRRRPMWIGAIAIGGLSLAGVGGAAASGAFSHGAKVAFTGWQDIDPSDAIHLATIDGPAATTISFYEAPDHANGQTCVSIVMHGDPGWDGHAIGGGCSEYDAGVSGGFTINGGSLSQVDMKEGAAGQIGIFYYSAGAAATAAIEYGGVDHPAVVSHGFIVGWVPQADWSNANLVGYDSAGKPLATLHGIGTDEPQLTAP